MATNYQKLDFLAEIGATKTLIHYLPEGEYPQRKIFKLKNAVKIVTLLIEQKIFRPELLCELIELNNEELIVKFLNTYPVQKSSQQSLIIATKNPRLIKLLMSKNELNAQDSLLHQFDRKLIKAYIKKHSFDRMCTVEFFSKQDPELMKLYITLHRQDFKDYRDDIEPYVFATEDLEVIATYCANLRIASKKVLELLEPDKEEILLDYLQRNTPVDNKNIHMLGKDVFYLAESGDRRVLKHIVFEKHLALSTLAEAKLFEFEDSVEWVKEYISYTRFHEKNEDLLFEPKYAELLPAYIKSWALRSLYAQSLLFEKENLPLLRSYIKTWSLHEKRELDLFKLKDNNELLKLYISKHGLSDDAEEHLFDGTDDELKRYYLAETGQDV